MGGDDVDDELVLKASEWVGVPWGEEAQLSSFRLSSNNGVTLVTTSPKTGEEGADGKEESHSDEQSSNRDLRGEDVGVIPGERDSL